MGLQFIFLNLISLTKLKYFKTKMEMVIIKALFYYWGILTCYCEMKEKSAYTSEIIQWSEINMNGKES